ncbi:unknown protein [Waddlia chondrophila 2032/99]|uniref:Uncharacterized protein n=1 Tax=Waddlia chondrophila 2032/99 TaxID=765953 RepID=F8LAR6_9BACT|nr:unknown protein [Waddlia chondrophila 2032/99]
MHPSRMGTCTVNVGSRALTENRLNRNKQMRIIKVSFKLNDHSKEKNVSKI